MNAPTTAVALAPTAPGQITSANEMNEALKAVQAAIAPDLNPSELKLFAMVAYRSGLDPFAKQIHAVKRQGKVTFQTGIDGFRSSAERTGTYDGQDEPEYGPACSCSEQPKPHPEWARVTVYRIRNGERKAQSATAFWHEFKPAPGSSGNGDQMWKKMPRNQLAKCAEALAFRKAFPYVLADVYSPEEMAQAGDGGVVVEHRPTARQAVAERAAALEADSDGGTDDGDASAAVAGDDDPDAGAPSAAAAESGHVVDGEAVEIPLSLTKEELLAELDSLGVSTDYALELARKTFELPANAVLTGKQRADLVALLRAEARETAAAAL